MRHALPKHEKVKFRRDDIAELHTLPSAVNQKLWKKKRSLHGRLFRICAVSTLCIFSIAIITGLLLYFFGISGISTDNVRSQVEVAAGKLFGSDIEATLGPAQISFDGLRLLAIDVNEVKLAAKGAKPVDIISAKRIHFGVRILPLAAGQIRLGSARIEDAVVFAGALPMDTPPQWALPLLGKNGLVNPDLVADAVFAAIHRLVDTLNASATRSIELKNVEIVLTEGSAMRSVTISSASLKRSFTGRLSMTVAAVADGRNFNIEAVAQQHIGTQHIGSFELSLTSSPPEIPAIFQSGTVRETSIGKLDFNVSGTEGADSKPSRLDVAMELGNSVIHIDPRNDLDIAVKLAAELVTDTGKLEIKQGRIESGRSHFNFSGAIGPKPSSDPSEKPSYRYEFVSNQGLLTPPDSPEPALKLGARLAGTFDPALTRLDIGEIDIRTAGGQILGTAALEFSAGKVPGISLVLSMPKMPTAHAKHIWPWIAASGARRWALANLFDGNVTEGHLQFRVPPGRLGNGIPLKGDEVSGHFKVAGTRFDVAGRIPPVRDATGTIDFYGNDVDIALSSGTIYLPSGGSVTGTNGKLAIRKDSQARIMGALDVDISGQARAITELASFEPIDAMRHSGMNADEFSGNVSGNVKADIPLNKEAQSNKPNWLVKLNFTDLAVNRDFEGQLVTAANGTIVVDAQKAVITADARLNGAPARVSLIEPVGDSPVEKQRKVVLTLDNKAREKIAAGLAGLLDGPVTLQFDAASGAARQIEMDITNAKLHLPWIGWSKGQGVAATASFSLATANNRTTLSNFRLEGKSFTVAGNIVVEGGELAAANFDKVQLNRGDQLRVSVKRNGNSFQVNVAGAALDARSLIKQVTADRTRPAATSRQVTVNADIKTLSGFNGANLSNIRLAYSGTGDRLASLSLSATTGTNSKVIISDVTSGGQRTMEISSDDAGSLLRFLDLYKHMEGGAIKLTLAGQDSQTMRGQINASNFWVVNEPKLASIVSTQPPGGARSLNQTVRSDIDTSRVQFERGFAIIEKKPSNLLLEKGVLRGPLIGLIFQGTLYDEAANMNMTGTFMPAYGLNRIFGEIPLFGQILGNGNDRGLIGVTFRLAGKSNAPLLQINPLSVVAPGIFRSIFEFR